MTPLYDVISIGFYKGDCDDLGLPFKNPYKKPINWKMDDFYRLGGLVGVGKAKVKKISREIVRIYIEKMPEYIEKVKVLEREYDLKVQKSRGGFTTISNRLQNMFQSKIISLKKVGILTELELIDVAGG